MAFLVDVMNNEGHGGPASEEGVCGRTVIRFGVNRTYATVVGVGIPFDIVV